MAIGKSKVTPDHKEKARAEKLCLFEVWVDARHCDPNTTEGTWIQGLKQISLAGACTSEDAHKMIDVIWGRNKKKPNKKPLR